MQLSPTGNAEHMEAFIDLKKLSLDELAGVVSLYPWFGGARKELCRRMSAAGGESWGVSQYAEAAMHLPSRRVIAGLLRSPSSGDCSDGDLSEILKKMSSGFNSRRVRVAGGDYFSQEQYDLVRKQDDSFVGRFNWRVEENTAEAAAETGGSLAFYTETLAQIYADQGYYEQAREIYSKLILAYPEKNTYFAALIEKLDQEIKK